MDENTPNMQQNESLTNHTQVQELEGPHVSQN